MLKVSLGSRMRAADDLARLLGVVSLFDECSLPQRVLDIANREARHIREKEAQLPVEGESAEADPAATESAEMGSAAAVPATPHDGVLTSEDNAFLKLVRHAACVFCDGKERKLPEIITCVATGCGMKPAIVKLKHTVKPRTHYISEVTLTRRLPDLMSDFLIYSASKDGKVSLSDWEAEHRVHDEDLMVVTAEAEWDEECGDDECGDDMAPNGPARVVDVASADTRDQRTEKLDGHSLAKELRLLREKGALNLAELVWLAWLEKADASAVPRSMPFGAGVEDVAAGDSPIARFTRYLTVTYGKRRGIGRRTASRPGMQCAPSGLRSRVAGRFYHDLDIRTCHPTLDYQVAIYMGVDPDELVELKEYVDNPDAVLNSIAEFYGVSASKCKFAVLRALNGGQVSTWIRDAKCPRNDKELHPHLKAMQSTHHVVQDAFFRMDRFKPHVAALTAKLRVERKAAVATAKFRVNDARSGKAALQKALSRAEMKAQPSSIRRTIFSLCVFELEDSILHVIDSSFKRGGWTVSSLQFDGLHVEHRPGVDLRLAMTNAEQAVLDETGYKIKLVEKALFNGEDV